MSELSADSRPDTQRVEVGMGAFARDFGRGAALYMESCIRCGNCAEACQFHLATRDPKYTPPRSVLAALGLELRETEGSGELAFCCGGGGGVIAVKRAAGLRRKAFEIKMRQIDATGAEVTLTSCANCRQTFDDGQAHYHWDRRMGSLLEVVADRLEPAPLTSPTSY